MKQARQIDEGYCFRWQGDIYVVVNHDDEDYVIVERVIDSSGRLLKSRRNEENFNPYCTVEKL